MGAHRLTSPAVAPENTNASPLAGLWSHTGPAGQGRATVPVSGGAPTARSATPSLSTSPTAATAAPNSSPGMGPAMS